MRKKEVMTIQLKSLICDMYSKIKNLKKHKESVNSLTLGLTCIQDVFRKRCQGTYLDGFDTFNFCAKKLGREKGILMVLGTYRRICFGRSLKCEGMVNVHRIKRNTYPHRLYI